MINREAHIRAPFGFLIDSYGPGNFARQLPQLPFSPPQKRAPASPSLPRNHLRLFHLTVLYVHLITYIIARTVFHVEHSSQPRSFLHTAC